MPPTVVDVTAGSSGVGYLSVHQDDILTVRGANFAPTGPYALRCLYTPLEPDVALAEREAGVPPPSALVSPPTGEEPAGSVAVPATYVSAHELRCQMTAATSPGLGDVRLRVAHSAEGVWSSSSALLTLYDASRPPALHSICSLLPAMTRCRAVADLARPTQLNVWGENFAPTGAGEFVCVFRANGGGAPHAARNATFVSATLVRCEAPYGNASGVGAASEVVDVRCVCRCV